MENAHPRWRARRLKRIGVVGMDLEEAMGAIHTANLRDPEHMSNAEVRAQYSDTIARRLCLGMSEILTMSLASAL